MPNGAIIRREDLGHWYALLTEDEVLKPGEIELSAYPLDADPQAPMPSHPNNNLDGWYYPEDLPEDTKRELIKELAT
jgi:hypothetical protein